MELSTSAWATALKAHQAARQIVQLRGIGPYEPGDVTNEMLAVAKSFRRELEEGRAALVPFITSEPSEITKKARSLPDESARD